LIGAALGASGVVLQGESEFYDVKHQSLLKLGTGWTYHKLEDKVVETPMPSRNPDFDPAKLYTQKREVAERFYPEI